MRNDTHPVPPLPSLVSILVLSRSEAEQFQPAARAICISISDSHVTPAALSPAFAAVLRLSFDDVQGVHASDERPFDDSHATAIMDFVRRHGEGSQLVVHCHAGVSRSPAVAVALAVLCGLPTHDLRALYPAWNRWVYHRLVQQGDRFPSSTWRRGNFFGIRALFSASCGFLLGTGQGGRR
jgi:predicted protein tyrosine phosphatase